MISCEEMNGNSLVGAFRNFSQHPGKSPGNDGPVFKPVIKDITHQKNSGSIPGDFPQPPGKEKLPGFVVIQGRCPKVNIGNKIYFLLVGQNITIEVKRKLTAVVRLAYEQVSFSEK